MKRLLWGLWISLIAPIAPLKSFKLFRTKIEKATEEEWQETLSAIKESAAMRKHFKLNQ